MICPNCGIRLHVGITKCHFCGNENSLVGDIFTKDTTVKEFSEPNFVDKFVALFTVIALFFAISLMFYEFIGSNNGDFFRPIFCMGASMFVMVIYLKISPWLIKNIFKSV